MASTKEIKDRIGSVKDTKKITNAMYLIASTKLTKAKKELNQTRPYFDALRSEIKRIFRTANDIDSPYFYPIEGEPKEKGTYGILVITADKGLAGAYNQNVIKEAEHLIASYHGSKLYVVGEYGRHYYQSHNIPIEKSFLYTAQNPTMERAREITGILLNEYQQKHLSKIFVVYTDLVNAFTTNAQSMRLLPFHRRDFQSTKEEKEINNPFGFYPSEVDVLNTVMFSYISGFIYAALVDSFCCEQNARMNAMKSANDNAEKLLDNLSLQYNTLRQAEITQEINEVSAGALALRKKHKREASK